MALSCYSICIHITIFLGIHGSLIFHYLEGNLLSNASFKIHWNLSCFSNFPIKLQLLVLVLHSKGNQ